MADPAPPPAAEYVFSAGFSDVLVRARPPTAPVVEEEAEELLRPKAEAVDEDSSNVLPNSKLPVLLSMLRPVAPRQKRVVAALELQGAELHGLRGL